MDQQSAQEKKGGSRTFAVIIAVVALAGIVALTLVVTRPQASTVLVAPPATSAPAGAGVGHLEGKADAPVEIDEFGDFECPHCAEFALVAEPDIRSKLIAPGIASLRYFDFPLAGFKHTWTAHIAASCAEDQGKFWEMHDRLYASQDEWNGLGTNDPVKVMTKYATDLGLDVNAWRTCVTTQATASRVQANQAEGVRRGFHGTPTFFIGRRMLQGGTYDRIKAAVDSTLAEQKAAGAVTAKPASASPRNR